MNPINFSIHDHLKKNIKILPHYQRVQLSVVLAKDVLPIFEEKYPDDNRPKKAIEAVEAWLADPSRKNTEKANKAGYAAGAAAWAAAAAAWAAEAAARAAWAAARAADTAGAAGAARVAYYNAISKFYKTIPDKQKLIEMLGRGR